MLNRVLSILAIVVLLAVLSPATRPWTARITNAYGSDYATSIFRGAHAISHLSRPVRLSGVLYDLRNSQLTGDVLPTTMVTGSTGMTVTFKLDDVTDEPDFAILTSPCYIEIPVGAAVEISASITNVGWDLANDRALAHGVLRGVGGAWCP